MNKLSIITINRNDVEGLRKTIESVVTQTFADFEYIIIDGASTDGSVEVIKQYTDRVTYWISEPDKGIYNAMNKGILKAKGEYCLFLNSGDLLVSNVVLAKIFETKYRIDVLCGYVVGNYDDRKTYLYPPENYTFRSFYGHNVPHQAEFIRRTLLISYGCYNEELKILSDYEFNIKALLGGAVFQNIAILVSEVNMNGISSDRQNEHILIEEGNLIFKKLIPDVIMTDYLYFLDKGKLSHPAILWLVGQKFWFSMIKLIYKLFR